MTKHGLPDRKLEILLFVDTFRAAHEMAPSFREIMSENQLSSLSHVYYYLDQMCGELLVHYIKRVARSIRILPAGQRMLRQHFPDRYPRKTWTGDYINSSARFHASVNRPTINIPILGLTKAGKTEMVFSPDSSPSVFGPDNELCLFKDALPRGAPVQDLFALQVEGDSMVGASINHGDYIVLRRTQEAERGEMVVVWLDDRNETTLKYFFPEKERIRLKPDNPNYEDILIEGERAKSLRILGKVVQVVRPRESP